MKQEETPQNALEHFKSLSPMDDLEKQRNYIDLLERGVADNDVCNVALTGPLGSGKSSILKGYMKKNSEKKEEDRSKILEISLADFDAPAKSSTPDTLHSGTPTQEQLIEKSILQQIFYTVGKDEVPYSQFARINILSTEKIFLYAFSLFLFVFSAYFTFYPDNFALFTETSWVSIFLSAFPDWMSKNLFLHFTFGAGVLALSYVLIKKMSSMSISNFSLSGAKIELENQKGSLLNEHIDELLYFFESTKYEVLIIEDLDRYAVSSIFKKLREINSLLNGYSKIERNITFIYAVKDNLFTGEERTKFFEWIIPVVPVINTSNASEKLITAVGDAGLDENLSEEFLKEISHYITDYRQLINIFNEYLLHRTELAEITNQEKLLSMVVYKNLFPEDCAKLHLREGYIYTILVQKTEDFRTQRQKNIKNKIAGAEAELIMHEDRVILDGKELSSVFFGKVMEILPDVARALYVNNQIVTLKAIMDDDTPLIYFLSTPGRITYVKSDTALGYAPEDVRLAELSKEYKERKEDLESQESFEKSRLLADIKALNDERTLLMESSFRDLVGLMDKKDIHCPYRWNSEDEANKEFWSNQTIQKWSLIEFFLEEGYIAEDYPVYISYFYGTKMSSEDYMLMGKIRDGLPISYLVKINKPMAIISELAVYDFKKSSILLLDIFIAFYEHLDSEHEIFNAKRKKFLEVMYKDKDKLPFVEYLLADPKNEKYMPYVLQQFSLHGRDLWIYLKPLETIGNADVFEKILLTMLVEVPNQDLSALEEEEDLVKYISTMPNFLLLLKKTNIKNVKNKIIPYLKSKNVKFTQLNPASIKLEAFTDILQYSLYEINAHMLINILSIDADKKKPVGVLCYNAIAHSEVAPLVTYIDENINTYVENILIEGNLVKHETKEGLVALLNHEELKAENGIAVIQRFDKKIEDMSSIPEEYWEEAFKTILFSLEWKDVFIAYASAEITQDTLLAYLSEQSVYNHLKGMKFTQEDAVDVTYEREGIAHEFFIGLIGAKELSIDALRAYKNVFDDCMDFSFILKLEDKRILELLELGYFCLSYTNFDDLKDRLSLESAILLIEKNFDDFLLSESKSYVGTDGIQLLFESKSISPEKKFELVKCFEASEVRAKNYFPLLYKVITDCKDKHLEDKKTIEYLMSAAETELQVLTLFVQHLEILSKEEIIRYLGVLSSKNNVYETLTQPEKRTKLPDTPENMLLVKALKEQGLIESYKKLKKYIQVTSLRPDPDVIVH